MTTISESKRYEMLAELKKLATNEHRKTVLDFIAKKFGRDEYEWLRERLPIGEQA